ncbi:MAG: hypothetical protein ABMB14_25845 [Myxococcota bacterium]
MRWKRSAWQAAICVPLVSGCLIDSTQTGDDDDDNDVVYQAVNVTNCTQDTVAVYTTNNLSDWGSLYGTLSPSGDLTEGGTATCENSLYIEFSPSKQWVRAIVNDDDCAGPSWESDDCFPQDRAYDVDVEIGGVATFKVN